MMIENETPRKKKNCKIREFLNVQFITEQQQSVYKNFLQVFN